jgi:hypothetical protein
MLDFPAEELTDDADWRLVLDAYQNRDLELRTGNPEEGWIPRLASVSGVEAADLSRAHGKLIALGFLKFEVSGNKAGIHYQVSPLGRQMLSGRSGISDPNQEEAEAFLAAELAADG